MPQFFPFLIVFTSLVCWGQCSESLPDIHVIDGHNDLTFRIRQKVGLKLDLYPFTKNLTHDPVWGFKACKACHTDLPRLQAGKVGAQFWSVYVECATNYKDAVEKTMEQLDLTHRFIRTHKDYLQLAVDSDAIINAISKGKIASLLGLEGGHSIDSRLSILRLYYEMGVRYMTLTHSCNVPWCDASPVDDDPNLPRIGGLTNFGKKVVLEMNRLGMMVDISHVSEDVMNQVLVISKAPVIFSHSSAHAINPHHRNVKDDVLRKLKTNKGIIMVNFYPKFIAPPGTTATIKTLMAHINHIVDVIGFDNIGLGGDYDGIESTPVGLEDVSKYPNLFKALHAEDPERWNVKNLQKLGNENLLRIMKEVENVRVLMENKSIDDDEIPIVDLESQNQIEKGIIKTCRSDMGKLIG